MLFYDKQMIYKSNVPILVMNIYNKIEIALNMMFCQFLSFNVLQKSGNTAKIQATSGHRYNTFGKQIR